MPISDKEKGVHLSHCYQGEYKTTCKYGEPDCPAKLEKSEKKKRFSKGKVFDYLVYHIAYMTSQHSFNLNDGTAQLRQWHTQADIDRAVDRAVAYGRLRAFQEIIEEFEL